jgi:hypothetical protein
MTEKYMKVALIVLAAGLIIAIVISGNTSRRQARQLQKEIDSVESIQLRYDSLQKAYNGVYKQLQTTQNRLVQFSYNLDSIMKKNKFNIVKLQNAVQTLINEQQTLEPLDTTETDTFRF